MSTCACCSGWYSPPSSDDHPKESYFYCPRCLSRTYKTQGYLDKEYAHNDICNPIHELIKGTVCHE